MKRIFLMLALLSIAWPLSGQTNGPVRLALIYETEEAAAVSDVLTAQLSRNSQIHLLERNEIEKVYREQKLSAGNKDYLKLGQILGADGLLLLDVVTNKAATNLIVRLIAVKPGVVLLAEDSLLPLEKMTEWAPLFEHHLSPFLPKLTLLVKDAIPISVVNLRCAVQSAEAPEVERELRLLTVQRLTKERQFFVLERQRMQSLAEEKELKLDDLPFWKGSYLIEGIVDQNGNNKETITINARLTPPKGSVPLLLEVSGSRSNFAEVINLLAAKVDAALKITDTAPAWNATDEAAQYFNEAKWALKWEVYSQAESAAEAAWALGKHDMDCAIIRIKSYAGATGEPILVNEIIDHSIADSTNESDRNWVIRHIKKLAVGSPGVVFTFGGELSALEITNFPSGQSLDHAIRALDLYRQFSQTQFSAGAKTDSPWYGFGIENLTVASKVLQHYYLVPKSRTPVLDKLEELRLLARSVAAWLTQPPTVRDSYFVANPNVDPAKCELRSEADILRCEVNWGCFWQDTPENCLALYCELLRSPSFSCFNDDLKSRGLDRPLFTAWKEEDQKRLTAVQDNFIQEMKHSPQPFLQEEAKIFQRRNLSGLNETEIISKYNDYWQDLKSGKRETKFIEGQIQYLTENRSWDLNEFIAVFGFREYSTSQAMKIKPLLDAYESNFVTELNKLSTETFAEAIKNGRVDAYYADSRKKTKLDLVFLEIDQVQAAINRVLHLAPPKLANTVTSLVTNHPLGGIVQIRTPSNNPAADSSIGTNNLLVKQYYAIPQEPLAVDVFVFPGREDSFGLSNEKIWAHSWREGKLVLDLRFYCSFSNTCGTVGGAAILDPVRGHWETVPYPKLMFHEPYSMEFFHGNLYLVDKEESVLDGNKAGKQGRILKYDFKTEQWTALKILDQGSFSQTFINQDLLQLSVVNNRLFAANFEGVFEITNDGESMRILASTRRRPAVSTLDLLDNLGSPLLRSGINNSLQALIGNNVYRWNEKDWEKELELSCEGGRELVEDGIFFRKAPFSSLMGSESLWVVRNNQSKPELALYQAAEQPLGRAVVSLPQKPLWPMPEKNLLRKVALTAFKSDIYCFADHSILKNIAGQKTAVEQDGYHAKLICLSRDCPEPIVVPLKFDAQSGPLPTEQLHGKPSDFVPNFDGVPNPSPYWILFAGDYLFIAEKHNPGTWLIPIVEVEKAVTTQKRVLFANAKLKNDAVEQTRNNLVNTNNPPK